MRRYLLSAVAVGVVLLAGGAYAEVVDFTLLTHSDNAGLLPQPKGHVGVAGDHLIRTPDDITGATFNPQGCFSFNFMNPVGIWLPDYPPGYAEGIHSMVGTLRLDMDMSGGVVHLVSLQFQGFIAPGRSSTQWAILPGDGGRAGKHPKNR